MSRRRTLASEQSGTLPDGTAFVAKARATPSSVFTRTGRAPSSAATGNTTHRLHDGFREKTDGIPVRRPQRKRTKQHKQQHQCSHADIIPQTPNQFAACGRVQRRQGGERSATLAKSRRKRQLRRLCACDLRPTDGACRARRSRRTEHASRPLDKARHRR